MIRKDESADFECLFVTKRKKGNFYFKLKISFITTELISNSDNAFQSSFFASLILPSKSNQFYLNKLKYSGQTHMNTTGCLIRVARLAEIPNPFRNNQLIFEVAFEPAEVGKQFVVIIVAFLILNINFRLQLIAKC